MAATTLDLPALGKPDQGDVGDDLELEDDVALLPRLAEQGEAGRLPARGGQGGVAQAAATATGDDVRGTGADEVGEHLAARRPDDGAAGHAQDDVGAFAPWRWSPAPGLPLAARLWGPRWNSSRVVTLGSTTATTSPPRPPLPPSGPPSGLNFSRMTEAHAVATVARLRMQRDLVDEGGHGRIMPSDCC